ncbi:MAG: hypothetical protein M1838_004290 [Thelocarpon superellum]|nr:MAG: hypothetical protein M1838_004290 [Thelocarpon superellum]
MEPAPLTSAHAHARAAFSQSGAANVTAAVEEHALAAGEFAQAAETTGDAEALRTLRLLEQHHLKLSEILKFRSSHPVQAKPAESAPVANEDEKAAKFPEAAVPAVTTTEMTDQHSAPHRTSQPPSLPLPHRTLPRDLTSSIASNLASARGIPSSQRRRAAPVSPTISAQHAGGKMAGTAPSKTQAAPRMNQRHSHASGKEGSGWTADGTETRTSPVPTARDDSAAGEGTLQPAIQPGDEPFQRFYSTFESLLSKISAPLAFAGLPLGGDEAVPRGAKVRDGRETSNAELDLSHMFSKAALRAARDGNTPGGAGTDSFYVVPSTGGTISYAGILSRAEQERRTASLPNEPSFDGDEEFVDAREMPQPPSPEVSRHQRSSAGGHFVPPGPIIGTKTMEELHLENQALKQLSDTLSRRLHMWEVNAQSSSMALRQSLRAAAAVAQPSASPDTSKANLPLTSTSPTPTTITTGTTATTATTESTTPETQVAAGAEKDRRTTEEREREIELKTLQDQLRASAREIAKLKEVIQRYRSKWEKLKEGARMRREGGGPAPGPGPGPSPGAGGAAERERAASTTTTTDTEERS